MIDLKSFIKFSQSLLSNPSIIAIILLDIKFLFQVIFFIILNYFNAIVPLFLSQLSEVLPFFTFLFKQLIVKHQQSYLYLELVSLLLTFSFILYFLDPFYFFPNGLLIAFIYQFLVFLTYFSLKLNLTQVYLILLSFFFK